MIFQAPRSLFDTHEVFNQSPPYEDIDLFESDRPLKDAVNANGGAEEGAALSEFGRHWGSAEMFALGRQANENPPKLHAFDAKGFRSDRIEFHPAYHRLMGESVAAGLHASTWVAAGKHAPPPAEVMRAARFFMAAQVETGHLCPITMTRAALAALAAEPSVSAKVVPKVLTRKYDAAFAPFWEKSGMTLGMGMTENQGGTDVRANTTKAAPCRRCLFDRRGQMVHVGADERRLSGAGAGAGRAHLFSDAAFSARWQRQCAALSAPQGQAWQPLQCLKRGGVHRGFRLADRRGGHRHPQHSADGATDPARLCGRLGRSDADGVGPGRASLPATAMCSRSRFTTSR